MRTQPSNRQETTSPTPAGAVSARGHEKWMARGRPAKTELQDWIEAKAETRSIQEMARKLVEVEERLTRQLSEHKESERRLAAEHAVSRILTVAHTIGDAAPQIIQAVCESLDWDVGIVWLVDRDTNELRCEQVWHTSRVEITAFAQDTRQRTFSAGSGLPGRVWADDSLIWIPDVTSDAAFPGARVAAMQGLHGAVGFPIRNGAEHLGVLEFFSREVRQPDQTVVQMMTSIGNQISQFVERRRAEKEVHSQQAERDTARLIQQGLLPRSMPTLAGFQISGRSAPANTVGGDCFDFIPVSSAGGECLAVLVADASGHGIGAALLIAETRAYVRALALAVTDVGRLLTLTNRRLASDLVTSDFVTAFLMGLDPRTRSLVYASAGHWPGYILNPDGQTRAVLPSTGLPLGIYPAGEFPVSPAIPLQPGDLILLFTDGIVEAASPDGRLFGLERMLVNVRAHQHKTPDDILQALFNAVEAFSEHRHQDDLTAVVIKAEDVVRK
jgi:serine phosphatase RsbU (regulator of sigma subunit)